MNTNVDKKENIFNSTILNIGSDFIMHEFVECDNKDQPRFIKKNKSINPRKNAAFEISFEISLSLSECFKWSC